MERERLDQLIREFGRRRVLVVGDCMLDKYLWGRVSRISPEAPVLVVEQERTSHAAGGASNVAANLVALGARAAITAVCGTDAMADVLLFSDYNKGVLTERVVAAGLAAARAAGRPALANVKPAGSGLFRELDLVQVNQSEAEAITGLTLRAEADLLEAGRRLLKLGRCRAALTTRGGHGVSLFEREGPVHHIPAIEQEVYDVTGAGDSVVAAAALAVACGASWPEVGVLANCA